MEAGSSARTCTALRLVLHQGLLRCLCTTRSATQQLLSSLPLSPGLDYDTLYLANTPLNELGVCEAADVAELRQQTNGLAVAQLKSLCGLYAEQRSELARRVCVSLLPECLANAYEEEHLVGSGGGGGGVAGKARHNLVAIFAQVTTMLKDESAAMAAVVASLDRQIMFHGGSRWEDGVNAAAAAAVDAGEEEAERQKSEGAAVQSAGAAASTAARDKETRTQQRRALLSESRDFLDSLGLVGRSLHTASAAAHICFSDVHELAQAAAEHRAEAAPVPDSAAAAAAAAKLAMLQTHYELVEATLTDAARYAASGLVGLRRVAAAALPTAADGAGGGGANGAQRDGSTGVGGCSTVSGSDSGGGSGAAAATPVPAAEERPAEDAEDRMFEAYTGPLEPLSPFDDDSLSPEEQKAAWKAAREARAVDRAKTKEAAALQRARLDNSRAVLSELRAVLGGDGGGGGK